jgi:hypothetical protein
MRFVTSRLYSFNIEPTVTTMIRLAEDSVVSMRTFNINVLYTETSRRISDALIRLAEMRES